MHACTGILSPEEMARTKALVAEFEAPTGRGRRLHEKLVLRAQQHRNWLDEWWCVPLAFPLFFKCVTVVFVVVIVVVVIGSSTPITSGGAPRR